MTDRQEFLRNLHNHWTEKLRDDVAEKEAQLLKLTNERAIDLEELMECRYVIAYSHLPNKRATHLLTFKFFITPTRPY